jgi:hypothetical protein
MRVNSSMNVMACPRVPGIILVARGLTKLVKLLVTAFSRLLKRVSV